MPGTLVSVFVDVTDRIEPDTAYDALDIRPAEGAARMGVSDDWKLLISAADHLNTVETIDRLVEALHVLRAAALKRVLRDNDGIQTIALGNDAPPVLRPVLPHCTPTFGGHNPLCDRNGRFCQLDPMHSGRCIGHGPTAANTPAIAAAATQRRGDQADGSFSWEGDNRPEA